jgi:hypothetical protein
MLVSHLKNERKVREEDCVMIDRVYLLLFQLHTGRNYSKEKIARYEKLGSALKYATYNVL